MDNYNDKVTVNDNIFGSVSIVVVIWKLYNARYKLLLAELVEQIQNVILYSSSYSH